MNTIYDEIELEDFDYDPELKRYSYPCPCGDRFLITQEELDLGETLARCPSCSLIIRVIH